MFGKTGHAADRGTTGWAQNHFAWSHSLPILFHKTGRMDTSSSHPSLADEGGLDEGGGTTTAATTATDRPHNDTNNNALSSSFATPKRANKRSALTKDDDDDNNNKAVNDMLLLRSEKSPGFVASFSLSLEEEEEEENNSNNSDKAAEAAFTSFMEMDILGKSAKSWDNWTTMTEEPPPPQHDDDDHDDNDDADQVATQNVSIYATQSREKADNAEDTANRMKEALNWFQTDQKDNSASTLDHANQQDPEQDGGSPPQTLVSYVEEAQYLMGERSFPEGGSDTSSESPEQLLSDSTTSAATNALDDDNHADNNNNNNNNTSSPTPQVSLSLSKEQVSEWTAQQQEMGSNVRSEWREIGLLGLSKTSSVRNIQLTKQHESQLLKRAQLPSFHKTESILSKKQTPTITTTDNKGDDDSSQTPQSQEEEEEENENNLLLQRQVGSTMVELGMVSEQDLSQHIRHCENTHPTAIAAGHAHFHPNHHNHESTPPPSNNNNNNNNNDPLFQMRKPLSTRDLTSAVLQEPPVQETTTTNDVVWWKQRRTRWILLILVVVVLAAIVAGIMTTSNPSNSPSGDLARGSVGSGGVTTTTTSPTTTPLLRPTASNAPSLLNSPSPSSATNQPILAPPVVVATPSSNSTQPSVIPSVSPSARSQSQAPSLRTSSNSPTDLPTVPLPSLLPSQSPSKSPTTMPSLRPTTKPSLSPSQVGSLLPTTAQSEAPTTATTTLLPSANPSDSPSSMPTLRPTTKPSVSPSMLSSSLPTIAQSEAPTTRPSASPSTISPTSMPTSRPTAQPSASPSSSAPSLSPSHQPTTPPSLSQSPTQFLPQWVQLGQELAGLGPDDRAGYSVSLSTQGDIVAVGSIGNDVAGFNAGHVRVFQRPSTSSSVTQPWVQMGQSLAGTTAGDNAGTGCALSGDGSVVAVLASQNGNPGLGYVQVYQFDSNVSSWIQRGQRIIGGSNADKDSVALSETGDTVVIGAVNEALARVFRFSNPQSRWIQIGNALIGSGSFGRSVAMSNDGTVVAVGAPGSVLGDDSVGRVRIFAIDSLTATASWVQMGDDLEGNGRFGLSVSLSADGLTVAVGAPLSVDDDGISPGDTFVYVFSTTNRAWQLLGTSIEGLDPGDNAGTSVALSEDGRTVAVGAQFNGGTGSGTGTVRVWGYNDSSGLWEKTTADIRGIDNGDRFGYDLALSGNGQVVAVGGFSNGVGDAGHARIFQSPLL